MEFDNFGQQKEIDKARMNFYGVSQFNNPGTGGGGGGQGSGGQTVHIRPPPYEAIIDGTTYEIGGVYRDVSIQMPSGSNTLNFRFNSNNNAPSTEAVREGDFFVYTVIFEDQSSATYFITPKEL